MQAVPAPCRTPRQDGERGISRVKILKVVTRDCEEVQASITNVR